MRVEFLDGAAGVANVVGSAVILALGVLVLLPQPRGRPQWSFALLAWGIGIGTGTSNLVFPDDPAMTAAMWAIVGIGHVVGAIGLVGVVQSVTGRLDGRQWATGIAAFLVFAAVMATGYVLPPGPGQTLAALGFPQTPTIVPGAFFATMFFAAGWAAAFVLARWSSRPGPRDRAQAALFSSCLVVYPAAISTQFLASRLPFGDWLAFGSMVAAVCVSAAWLASSRRGDRRVQLAASWAPLAIVTLGLVAGANSVAWVGGASRIIMTALAAFAILRYHAFGIHTKLRFGISKGSVAGVVVAVVFMVSEGAQSLFGEDKQWLGLVVGGLVVFAIAPIQRAADRFAERAVPSPRSLKDESSASTIYRKQAALVWSDGKITAKERRLLRQLRDELHLPPHEADRIDDEVAPR